MPEHVKHPRALVEGHGAEQLLAVRDIGHEDRPVQLVLRDLVHLRLIDGATIAAFLPQHRCVRREAFVQPHVPPVANGKAVAEPLVRELVRENGIVRVIARDQLLGVARQRLMLAEAVRGELGDAILLAQKRILAEALHVTAHDVRHAR